VSELQVRLDQANGDGKQHVTYQRGDLLFPDTVDMCSAFQREESIKRAARYFGADAENVTELSRQLATLAAQNEQQAVVTKKEPPPFTRLLTGAELLALDLKPRFLVRGVLVDGQPMIVGGRSKTLKTSVACDLAVSLGSGTPFLGRFHAERVAVGFWSGESGAATIRETAKRIAETKGVGLADVDVSWSFDLPRLSHLDHLDHLAETIRAQGLRVAILDPLYLALLSPETAGGASNVFLMGAMLQGLTRLAQDTGCTIILCHHFRKGGQPDDDNPAGLEELSQSGVAEWARQWLLLQRRTPYQADGVHSLWLRCGGSAGHSSLWGVTIEEGLIDPETFEGRKWDVVVSPAAEARQDSQREREHRKVLEIERREDEHRQRALTVLRQTPDGDTERQLAKMARLNLDNFSQAILTLLQEGRAERCKISKNGAEYDGWKPTGK
jgi:replicative DNA helicase